MKTKNIGYRNHRTTIDHNLFNTATDQFFSKNVSLVFLMIDQKEDTTSDRKKASWLYECQQREFL